MVTALGSSLDCASAKAVEPKKRITIMLSRIVNFMVLSLRCQSTVRQMKPADEPTCSEEDAARQRCWAAPTF
jgi:hypothetical protein